MEHNEFLTRLESLAELKVIKPARKSGEKIQENVEIVQRQGRAIPLTDKLNPTRAYEVKRIKAQTRDCDSCDKTVTDRRINKILYTRPQPHWREYCTSCKKFKNPESGLYEIDNGPAYGFFASRMIVSDK